MNTNEQLITDFYTAFQKRDYKTMQACYASNATFSDEVFVDLNATQVKAMWEMLITKGKDLVIEFGNVYADEKTGRANWKATYSFSKNNRKVVNQIRAEFTFENGKITQHNDQFDFYKWARQALGFTGILLGWTKGLKRKVREQARKNLSDFCSQHVL